MYELSDQGRAATWDEWQRVGGCGLTHIGQAFAIQALGPMSRWESVTLGQIADAHAAEGRSLARFAVEHLGRREWAQEYVRR